MRHRWILALLLGALAAGSWWLAGNTPETVPVHQLPDKRQVDYYLRKLDSISMSEQGQPARQLMASEVRHYDNDNTTELIDPKLTLYHPGEPPWVITATRGWVSANGDQVLLPGQVNITRAAAPGIKPIHLVTSKVRIQPHQDYAQTDEQVRVRSGKDRIDAVGMHAWFGRSPRIKFLSDVKGYYAPPPD